MLRGGPGADRTGYLIMVSRRAILPAKVDDLKVPLTPVLPREELLQIRFRLPHVLSFRQSPSVRKAMDMRVDREGRLSEGLGHHDAGSLVANARKLLELFDVARHLAAVMIDQRSREIFQSPRFARSEAAASDQFQDFMLGKPGQRCGRGRSTEKCRRDAIDLRVSRLCREHDRNEKRERIAMAEGDVGLGKEAIEDRADFLRLLRARHGNRSTKSGRGGEASVCPMSARTSRVGTGPSRVRRSPRT